MKVEKGTLTFNGENISDIVDWKTVDERNIFAENKISNFFQNEIIPYFKAMQMQIKINIKILKVTLDNLSEGYMLCVPFKVFNSNSIDIIKYKFNLDGDILR